MTARYDKKAVAAAAQQKIALISDAITRFLNFEDKRIEARVIDEMKPKWFRPWMRSKEKAQRTVLLENVPFLQIDRRRINNYSEDLRKAVHFAEMAENAQNDIIMDQNDAEFLFHAGVS